jgi:hypothetical protein
MDKTGNSLDYEKLLDWAKNHVSRFFLNLFSDTFHKAWNEK